MKGLCSNCEKRETCKALCPEAEAYVSQDHVTFPGGKGGVYLRDQTIPEHKSFVGWEDGELKPIAWADLMGDIPELSRDEITRAMFDGMTDEQTEGLIEYFYEGKTFREIAAELGLNQSSVFKRVQRAKAAVITYLWHKARYMAVMRDKGLNRALRKLQAMPLEKAIAIYAPNKCKLSPGPTPKSQLAFACI